ncbi:alcohol dehydrogenase superfamily, zinc-containing protein [Phyllosticta capitalensis]|uniref:alcohol dehydrogenase superfamily, zinc-containing protein n=1 Tax=Phyllosticta capitalensis TaxID=121624 RepID=UPI00313084B9
MATQNRVWQRAAGATVIHIATSSSDDKLDFAKKVGAKYTVNYKTTPDWSAEVLRLTNGKGVDHVIEVGGSSTIEQSPKSVRNGGLVTALGVLTFGEKTDLIPLRLVLRGVIGAGSKEMKSRFVEFIEEHDIRPVIASTFLFDEAPQALARLEKQREIGKIVIKIES